MKMNQFKASKLSKMGCSVLSYRKTSAKSMVFCSLFQYIELVK